MFELLGNSLQLSIVIIFGAIVGSFLTMLCYRLPLMEAEREQAYIDQINRGEQPLQSPKLSVSLWLPRSFCIHCQKAIPFYFNIPIIGYFLSAMRCRYCQQKIALSYLLIEVVCVGFAVAVYWKFSLSSDALFMVVAIYLAFALAIIDWNHHMLPSVLTTILLWSGLIYSVFSPTIAPASAIIGAVVGYLSLWLMYHLMLLLTKKESLGYGDMELLAAIGAWLGWQLLPLLLLIATLSCLITIVCLVLLKRSKWSDPYPFGFFLALSFVGLLYFPLQWL